jgi:hypothetical protein
MKTSRAALFTQHVLRYESDLTKRKFSTWPEFCQLFIEEFCLKNETQMALAKLETPRYHQNRRSVDDYIDEFCELIDQAGYTEGLAIMVKFRKGLNREIQNQIAQLVVGRPGDAEPEEWYKAAVMVEENRVANNLFHNGYATTTPRLTGTSFGNPKASGIIPTRTTPTSFTSRPTPLLNPVPMEIDAMKWRRELPDSCWRCGEVGHWAKNCPKRYDIRFLSAEEKEEIIQEWSLQADVEEVREKVSEAETEMEKAEDFQ